MDFEQSLVYETKGILSFYPLQAPEGTKCPYGVYRLDGDNEYRTLDEIYIGKVNGKYELSIYHPQYGQVKSLKNQVINKLKSFINRNIGQDGPYIQDMNITNNFELKEPFVDEYRGIIEFEVSY